jgi:hypothetical protein
VNPVKIGDLRLGRGGEVGDGLSQLLVTSRHPRRVEGRKRVAKKKGPAVAREVFRVLSD